MEFIHLRLFFLAISLICVFGDQSLRKSPVQGHLTLEASPTKDSIPPSKDDGKALKEVSRQSELFSMKLLQAVSSAQQKSNENFVISPFSIWSLMLLVAEGASEQSLNQLKDVLQLSDLNRLGSTYNELQKFLFSNTSSVGLSLNQALFPDIDTSINQNFVEIISNEYRANHRPVNFRDSVKAAESINSFIRSQTHGKIANIVSAQDLINSHLLLSSSIFFNGQWKFPFNVSHTKMQPFHDESGKLLKEVPMMTQQNTFRFANFENLNASFIELPYGDEDRLAMLLIYPLRNANISTVFQNLKRIDIEKIHAEIYKFDDISDVIVSLPRFKIDSSMELREALEQLGISDVFDRTKANLSKMSRDPTFISHVYHKAILEVDEIGTVAAATSFANAVDFSYPLEYTFDRPFGFMITERTTHTLLFAGQVKDPIF